MLQRDAVLGQPCSPTAKRARLINESASQSNESPNDSSSSPSNSPKAVASAPRAPNFDRVLMS